LLFVAFKILTPWSTQIRHNLYQDWFLKNFIILNTEKKGTKPQLKNLCTWASALFHVHISPKFALFKKFNGMKFYIFLFLNNNATFIHIKLALYYKYRKKNTYSTVILPLKRNPNKTFHFIKKNHTLQSTQ